MSQALDGHIPTVSGSQRRILDEYSALTFVSLVSDDTGLLFNNLECCKAQDKSLSDLSYNDNCITTVIGYVASAKKPETLTFWGYMVK